MLLQQNHLLQNVFLSLAALEILRPCGSDIFQPIQRIIHCLSASALKRHFEKNAYRVRAAKDVANQAKYGVCLSVAGQLGYVERWAYSNHVIFLRQSRHGHQPPRKPFAAPQFARCSKRQEGIGMA
jgi:hypothetical protein